MFRKHIPNLIALGIVGFQRSNDKSQDVHPVIIIGSGPSAHTAAIYSARANLHPSNMLYDEL